MAGKLAALSALISGTALSTAAAPGATAPTPAADAGGEGGENEPAVVLASEALPAIEGAKAEGHAAGVKAERERTAAVFASDAGKANPSAAAFMLANSEASAETIVAKLPEMGAAAPAPGAATTPDKPAATTPLTVDLSTTSKTDLGAPGANANDTSDTVDVAAIWSSVEANRNPSAVTGNDGKTQIRQAGSAN